MTLATITTKGQVTIPKNIRDSLRLNTGDKIEFVLTDDKQALIKPVSVKVDDVYGTLHNPQRKPVSIETMDTAIRQKMKDTFR